MGRPRKPVPSYLHYKPRNLAFVRINGQNVYLGPYGSAESKREYKRVCTEFESQSPAAPVGKVKGKGKKARTVTFAAVVRAFWEHSLEHYRDAEGNCTSEIKCLKGAIEEAVELYGHTPAVEFGPLAVKALRKQWIKADLARTTINARVNRLRRMYKWAASEELIPIECYTALTTIQGLEKGRSKARETEPIRPVADLILCATLPHLNATFRAMVLTQRLTGMRPQDVVRMRARDINQTVEPWVYEPGKHKTAYRGGVRRVRITPSGREILKPILNKLKPDDVVFSPRRAKIERHALLRAKRKTKVQPSQVSRAKKPSQLERPTPEEYSTATYAKAIRVACEKAGLPHWHPNQLRHTFGTEARERFGLEAAQVLLGHTKANVTEVYAERDRALAAKIAEQMG